jgi:hypothetical protein
MTGYRTRHFEGDQWSQLWASSHGSSRLGRGIARKSARRVHRPLGRTRRITTGILVIVTVVVIVLFRAAGHRELASSPTEEPVMDSTRPAARR